MSNMLLLVTARFHCLKPLTSFSLLLAAWLLATSLANPVSAAAGPYIEGRFQGRIASSCDGNHNARTIGPLRP